MRWTPTYGCVASSLLVVLSMEMAKAEAVEGPTFKAVDHTRRTIYHSPQTPGYTCWTGAWNMPDGNLMVSFTQATGPIDGRPKAPQEIMHQLSWLVANERPLEEPSTVRFSEHLIADKYAYAYGIAAADIDDDGDLDLTSADYTPHNMLYLFENDGGGVFRRHLIQKDDPERLERHMVGDVDGDHDLDVVIVKNLRGHLLWFENNGLPTDRKLWRRHVITTKLPGAYDVALADFNRDGHLDVAASSWVLGNQFAWFENDGTPAAGEWKKHLIEKDAAETRTMRAADFDGDGDIDVAATSWRNPGRVAWFENRGDPKGSWTRHLLKENWRSANQVIIADLNGDGRPDIAACAEQ